jgi:acyl-CoA synthetase (AMP-forming)/AMP-acid ligase II
MAWLQHSTAGAADPWYQGTPLTTLLGRWARSSAAAPAISFVDYATDRQGVVHTLTWAQLDQRARAVAVELAGRAAPGARAALLAPQGLDYVVGFLGALYAGLVAVPLFAPGYGGHGDRLVSAIADADPEVWLTTSAAVEDLRRFADAEPVPRAKHLVRVDAVPARSADGGQFRTPDADDVAYLQYTSGSTRTPTGAMITHRNVVANARQALSALSPPRPGPATHVGWLPLFHDMGLLLSVAAPLVAGGHSVFMDPLAFVQRPSRWLRLLGRHQQVASAVPNFALEHCVTRTSEAERAGLDLSSVFALVNGSEPISAGTLRRFTATFAPHGLRPEAVRPAYGLAEATVFVSTTEPGAAPTVTAFDRAALGGGVAVPAAESGAALDCVGCGRPVGQELLVVDPDSGTVLPTGRVGEIWVRGVNVAAGYWGAAGRSARAFGARPLGEADDGAGRWLRTGDLGVEHDGQLYITGRIKDLIIVDGRNHYPQDIEATVRDAHPAVRAGQVAAFPLSGEDGAGVVVVAEYGRHLRAAQLDVGAVARAVRGAVSRRHELSTRDFVLVPPGSVPRTSSGKIARSACRARYLTGGYTRPAATSGALI